MIISPKAQQIARLEEALLHANSTGNSRLATTLTELLNTERARSPKASSKVAIEEVVSESPRTEYNPRRASIKLKAELYDIRIDLEDKEAIAARWEAFQQRRRVFARV